MAQAGHYDDLFARFNAAIDYLQQEVYQLQAEHDALVQQDLMDAADQVEARIDQLEDEINSLNQDSAWVAIRASGGARRVMLNV